MSRKFQCKVVPSVWIEQNDRRLDCGPYVSGAIEARELLARLETTPLNQLTKGHNGGIYNGSPFVRNYVEDPEHGVPFLTTSSLLQADLSNVSYLSKRDAQSRSLSFLEIKPGMSLITCSGSIGRMVYARDDLDGVWSNQDIMKVVPDSNLIQPGYLYAYLSGRFGVPLIVSGTYGAIIQHIEPHHIASLPVPRLAEIESQADELVLKAAALRTRVSNSIAIAMRKMEAAAGLSKLGNENLSGVGFGFRAVSSSSILRRMDAVFHSPFHSNAVDVVNESSAGAKRVGEIADSIFEPKRFKRVQVEDEEFGVPMFGTTALMWADPLPSFLIPKTMAGIDALIVDKKTVLIPRSGQVSGIIGTAVLPYGKIIGGAVSEHAIRIRCRNEIDAGYLFIALRSEYGRRQLKSRAYGSSIPALDVEQVGQVIVPDLQDRDVFEGIGTMGLRSAELRGQAIALEDQARSLVEHAIEEAAR